MKVTSSNPEIISKRGFLSSAEGNSLAVFEQLAMPLLNPLYNLARWLTRNGEDAEDLVQETYLKAWQGFSSFQLGTNFRAWMYRILRNCFLSSRTRLQATMTVPLEEEDDGVELAIVSETPESLLMARSNRELVRSVIEKLPVQFREVIVLCDMEEMSYREIAETLSIPIGTVMSRLARARTVVYNELRKALQVDPITQSNRQGCRGCQTSELMPSLLAKHKL